MTLHTHSMNNFLRRVLFKPLSVTFLLLPMISCLANEAGNQTTKLDVTQVGNIHIERPSALYLYAMARKSERESNPENAAEYYNAALKTLRNAEAGYDYTFGKEIAEHYISLLKELNKFDEARTIEKEFCQNVCSNPWSLAKEKWRRFVLPLPASSGVGLLDVRMIHPIMAEYEYRFTGKYLNRNFSAKPRTQPGGPPNLKVSWLKDGRRASILFFHDDKNFQGHTYEIFDLTSKTMSAAKTKAIKRGTDLAYLDQFLRLKLKDGTQIRSTSIGR